MPKTELRKIYKQKRTNLSSKQVEQKSIAIANQSLKLPIWKASIYSLFLSIEDKKEVDTHYLLSILQGKDKDIVLSKSNFSTYEMTHFLLTDNTKIKINQWGIPEPVDGITVPPDKIDVVFVPLLAFDKNGHRIGYGKGFYDRFLASCKPSTVRIGVSFFEIEDQQFPSHQDDIPLNYCITPEKIYEF